MRPVEIRIRKATGCTFTLLGLALALTSVLLGFFIGPEVIADIIFGSYRKVVWILGFGILVIWICFAIDAIMLFTITCGKAFLNSKILQEQFFSEYFASDTIIQSAICIKEEIEERGMQWNVLEQLLEQQCFVDRLEKRMSGFPKESSDKAIVNSIQILSEGREMICKNNRKIIEYAEMLDFADDYLILDHKSAIIIQDNNEIIEEMEEQLRMLLENYPELNG